MTAMTTDVTGGVALVSGGASGIGAATVRLLARRGLSGVTLDVREPDDLPPGWEHVSLDLSEVTGLQACVTALRGRLPAPRLLVNAAGVNGRASSAFEVDVEEWDRVLDVNLRGTFFLARDVLAWMRDDARGGHIVNVASQLASVVVPPNPHYQISKAGVLQVTRALALAGAPHSVQVNTVSPGIVNTPMTEGVMSDASWTSDRLARIPAGRFAEPEEIAEVIVAVGLLETSYLTGTEIVVDGGYLLP
jgi:NAD(P)-dependent dehydrogenase (short-subunit alcohol dehydrogenase family)